MGERTALITGASGYIGWHVARRLIQTGWNVTAVVRPSSNLVRLESLPRKVAVLVHDGSTDSMFRIVRSSAPDTVFHLAAHALSGHQPDDVVPLLEANITFGTQLLEAMAANGIQRLVTTGTHWQHYDSQDYSPVCLYAACKQAFWDIVRYYSEARGVAAINLILFDTYGPADSRPKLFQLLRAAAASREPLAMTPGDQLIDLVHVEDVAEAYRVAAELLHDEAVYRYATYAVRSNEPIKLRDVVRRFEDVSGTKVPVIWGGRPYRTREIMVPWSEGETLPGWEARIRLSEGLRVVIA
jgi:nucleoside-diphosphate-sugar epimerase